MIETFKLLFTDPKQFFKELKNPSYSTVLKFLFYVIFIPYLLNYYFSAGLEEGFTNYLFATSAIVALLTILIGPFFSAALTHIGVKLFKKSGYKKTFYASAHAMAVNAPYVLAQAVLLGVAALSGIGVVGIDMFTLLGIIISFIGLVHVIVTEIYGLKQLHGLSTGQAVVSSVVIPLGLIFLLLILLVVLVIVALGGLLSPTLFMPPA